MTTKTKIAAAALAAVTLAGSMVSASSEAQARGGRNAAIAIGVASGLALGALAAGSYYAEPVYVGGTRCRWVSQFDAWGNYMGKARVCRTYY